MDSSWVSMANRDNCNISGKRNEEGDSFLTMKELDTS